MILRPLLLALGLLTRLPAPWRDPPPTTREMGQSLLYYPLVGLLLGGILVLFARMLDGHTTPAVEATLLLIAWVWLTGGLHLDGLADTADGWVGGMGDREKTLAIMKDPQCGPAGVMAVVLLLLLKWTALQALLQHHASTLLLIAPVLGRASLVALFLRLPYVRIQGMGAMIATALPYRMGWLVIGVCASGLLLIWPMMGIVVLSIAGLTWHLLQSTWMRRLGGMTGDSAGATCEIIEAVSLTVMTFWTG